MDPIAYLMAFIMAAFSTAAITGLVIYISESDLPTQIGAVVLCFSVMYHRFYLFTRDAP